MRFLNKAIALLSVVTGVAGGTSMVLAQAPVPFPEPPSLKGKPVPEPDNLSQFVKNKTVAIALGKALFWDQGVGSDGNACASCHFHAGADSRVKNQLTPGFVFEGDVTFGNGAGLLPSGRKAGPNASLTAADFPLFRLANPNDRTSTITYETNDAVSSQGAFKATYTSSTKLPFLSRDKCEQVGDEIFHVGGVNLRQVEPRNTPTMINAVFNRRNFWDGRAMNIFNGVTPFGVRDGSTILEKQPDGSVTQVQIEMKDFSIASQSVGPVVSDLEMRCADRKFADVGRKLLSRRGLELQWVHAKDSALAPYRNADTFGLGLKVTYAQLVKEAFQDKYWNAAGSYDGYTQMEANFPLFWGLAVALYQASLVSDDAPYDRYKDGLTSALTAQQKRGLTVFMNNGCVACHQGPAFTDVSVFQAESGIDRLPIGGLNGLNFADLRIFDRGFFNIGVRPVEEDPGVAGTDENGKTFSHAKQYIAWMQNGTPMTDKFGTDACQFGVPFATCASPTPADKAGLKHAADGAFKVPSLRNVELTGPYFHNGFAATLEQVVEFYNRGGNARPHASKPDTSATEGRTNLGPGIQPLNLTTEQKADLVAFLKSLTDERVRCEKKPFDHPSLRVPNGREGDQYKLKDVNFNGKVGEEEWIDVPAVGADGRVSFFNRNNCLKPFLQ